MFDLPGMIDLPSSPRQTSPWRNGLAGWQERYPEVTVRPIVEFEFPRDHLLEQSEPR